MNENVSNEKSKNRASVSRRQFGKTAAVAFGAASGFHFFPALADKKLEKPALAGIGAGGKGAADISGATSMAKGCPMVKDGSGSVEIAEIHAIEM